MLAMDSQSFPRQKGEDIAYLRISITPQMVALLPMDATQEVLTLPARRLTLIPNMPDCVMGIVNQRSHFYWAVDLAKLLGLTTTMTKRQSYNLALLNAQTSAVGLIIQGIDGVIRAPLEALGSPLQTSHDDLSGYLQGTLSFDGVSWPVLNPRSIISDERLCPE